MICIVFQRLSRNLPMFVFVFAKKLARISLILCKVVSLEKNFSVNARIVFRHLNMDYITLLNVILKDLSKLSLSFTIKTQL